MTRDDIYDHLAQVYLGKRKESGEKKPKQFNVWLLFNVMITGLIFLSVFYGLTAFLTSKRPDLKSQVQFPLTRGSVSLAYDFQSRTTPVQNLSFDVFPVTAAKYQEFHLKVLAKEEGSPGILKVEFRNQRNEFDYVYLKPIDQTWQNFTVRLDELDGISDWSVLSEVNFVLESWNVQKSKGLILIDDIHFSS